MHGASRNAVVREDVHVFPDPLVSLRDTVREDGLRRAIRAHISIRSGASIVEIGIGNAELATWLASSAPARRVVGIDVDPALTGPLARQQRHARLANLSFVLGSAHRLPVCDESADLVLCKNLLCVLDDVDSALDEMCRIAKPGGTLLAIEPASPQQFHDPGDRKFATLSQRLNQAFYHGWKRRGVDQRIGIRVPSLFLSHGLEQVRVEVVSRVHLLADALRTTDDIQEQLETEAYRLPEATVALLREGGMSQAEIAEHYRLTRERLRQFLDEPERIARSGYTRLNPAVMVTMGRKPVPT